MQRKLQQKKKFDSAPQTKHTKRIAQRYYFDRKSLKLFDKIGFEQGGEKSYEQLKIKCWQQNKSAVAKRKFYLD